MQSKNNTLFIFAISLVSIVILVVGAFAVRSYFSLYNNEKEKNENLSSQENDDSKVKTNGVEIIPTMLDKISEDSSWCPTFELVWQDMKNNVVLGDIIYEPQIEYVSNLNKSLFTENDISENYYYKKWGLKTLDLKNEIEKGIKEKFNQTSDILEKFNWDDTSIDDINRYFFYTMLYREFEYLYEFDKLENSNFKQTKNVKYFGIDEKTDDKVRNNINVLFYEDAENYAVSLNTKDGDVIILYKNPISNTFKGIYDEMNKKITSTKSISNFRNIDTFKMPYIKFNVLKEYEELEGRVFKTNNPNYPEAMIIKALQSIQFEIDNKGGKVKSEAAIDMTKGAVLIEESEEARHFNFDDTFVIFLKEQDKNLPYLALRINDITKYQ